MLMYAMFVACYPKMILKLCIICFSICIVETWLDNDSEIAIQSYYVFMLVDHNRHSGIVC